MMLTNAVNSLPIIHKTDKFDFSLQAKMEQHFFIFNKVQFQTAQETTGSTFALLLIESESSTPSVFPHRHIVTHPIMVVEAIRAIENTTTSPSLVNVVV